MRAAVLVLALAALAATAARAGEPVGCDKFKFSVAQDIAALRAPGLTALSSGAEIGAAPFSAAVRLRPAADAGLPQPPERAAKDGTFAGYLSLKSLPPGLYSVSLSAAAWLDLVHEGRYLKPEAFSGVQGCEGIRKVVRFRIDAAPLVVQVSGVASESIAIAILPAAD